ncbi:MAG TPA: long-chain fatty acid--CoA ligase [Stellaceae bacterium]|nr:long-chain fatty acid--CoA ligase [Stellaceae bacterium]
MNLSHWLERWAEQAPERPALRFETRDISYAEMFERSRDLAATLKHRLGVECGDRVAHLGYNSPELILLIFACARLGAMLVPLNWRLAAPEHAFIVANAGAKAWLFDAAFAETVTSVLPGLPACRPVCIDGGVPGFPALAELEREAGWDDANTGSDYAAPLLIVYTSGTTGRPKGAVLSQDAMLWNAINSTAMHDLTSRDRVLTTLPMFHVGGLNIQTLPALHAGATVILHRRFEPAACLAAIEAERPTLAVLVPAQITTLLVEPRWATTDFSSLRLIATGSSIVPRPLIEAIHARGVPVIPVYGSTETAPIAIFLRPEDAQARIGSTGKPAPHCEIRIIDDTGADVADGRSGELLVRGRNVMTGYWQDPGATAEALRDGWFHTGDVGHRDAAGFIWIDDRKKDVIISGGENIYPAELEAVLAELPGIAESAVIGAPDARWSEVPVAIVVMTPSAAADAEAILAAFQGRLARFKHPRRVVFADRLPRNSIGKVQKHELRARLHEL